jgi:hypothetical protein
VAFLGSGIDSLASSIADFFRGIGEGTSPTPPLGGSPSPTPTPTVTATSGSGGLSSASAWFAFTLHFSDGTSQDLNMNPTFSLFPLSITWQGKTLSSMDVLIRLKVSGSNLGSWSTVSSQHIEIYFESSTTPAASSTVSFSKSGSSWASGQTQTIQTTTIDAQTLDTIFNVYGTGTWIFQTTGTVTLTMNGQQYGANMGQNDITLENSGTLSISSLTGTHLTTTQLTPR